MDKNIDDGMRVTDCIGDIKELVDDWGRIETREIEEQAERLIVEKARELVKIADAENLAPSRPPAKSEMACNCKRDDDEQEKSLEEVVADTAEKVRGTNCIAVIIADERTWARSGKNDES